MKDAGMLHFMALSGTPAVALNSTGVKLRVPALERLTVFEVGVVLDNSADSNGALIITVSTEDKDESGVFLDVGTITSSTSVVKGTVLDRKFNFNVPKGDVVVVRVTTADGNAIKGIPYVKAYPAGQGEPEPNEVSVQS